MTTAPPDGSIISLQSPRPDLLAFEVRDKITKPNIEWMSSIAAKAMDAHDKIDMLIIMANFEGSDRGATFDRHTMGVQARSVAHVRRYAVVGAPLFARAMIAVSGVVTPVETKTFDLGEEKRAWAWVDADRNDATTSALGRQR